MRAMVGLLAPSAVPAVRGRLFAHAPGLVQAFPWLPAALAPRK
jgi:hypothetical protein